MKQTKKVGSVNPCNVLMLFDAKGNEIGKCLDTPNAFAIACYLYDDISFGTAYYQYFGRTQRNRNDSDTAERIEMFRQCVKNGFTDTVEAMKRDIKMYI